MAARSSSPAMRVFLTASAPLALIMLPMIHLIVKEETKTYANTAALIIGAALPSFFEDLPDWGDGGKRRRRQVTPTLPSYITGDRDKHLTPTK
jgi:hypothetical protein